MHILQLAVAAGVRSVVLGVRARASIQCLSHCAPLIVALAVALQDYVEQLSAFMDGIALCHLLNATCVLPKWYRCVRRAAAGSGQPTGAMLVTCLQQMPPRMILQAAAALGFRIISYHLHACPPTEVMMRTSRRCAHPATKRSLILRARTLSTWTFILTRSTLCSTWPVGAWVPLVQGGGWLGLGWGR